MSEITPSGEQIIDFESMTNEQLQTHVLDLTRENFLFTDHRRDHVTVASEVGRFLRVLHQRKISRLENPEIAIFGGKPAGELYFDHLQTGRFLSAQGARIYIDEFARHRLDVALTGPKSNDKLGGKSYEALRKFGFVNTVLRRDKAPSNVPDYHLSIALDTKRTGSIYDSDRERSVVDKTKPIYSIAIIYDHGNKVQNTLDDHRVGTALPPHYSNSRDITLEYLRD